MGAAALIAVQAGAAAQAGLKQAANTHVPAVAPLAAKSAAKSAPVNAADAAPTIDPAGAEAPTTEPAKAEPASVVQEAKNNDAAGTIDASKSDEPKANPDDTNGIAATVNDESISEYELRQRVALYLATSGITGQLTDEQRKRIRTQILEKLEDEKVQLAEALKKKITVSPVEVDKWINGLLSGNRMTIQQLRASLTAAGASEEALRAQVTATIAWQKTVQDEYSDRVNVTPEMINLEMAKNAEGAHKTHYHVMEIFLPVDNPEQDAKVKKDAEEIVNQLHQGAPFAMVARQFSQHPTAATGGDIGWVYDGQLAPELNAAIAKLEVGTIAPPIRSTGGYYVLAVRERQEAVGTKTVEEPKGPTGPAGTLPLARMLLPLNPRAPKAELDQVMTIAKQIREHFNGCGSLEDIHKKLPGSVYMDLGNAKLEDLSPQIQTAMKDSHPGDAAEPFMSDAGIEIIARCDKRPQVLTAYVLPTRQQVEDELFQGQISTLARRYLRDLRRDANIQVRDDSKTDALIR